jgi:hypothetical protein
VRDAAEVDHGEQVRVAHLVLEAEPDHVELGQRRERFEPVQRQAVGAQLGLEVEPRGERAFMIV